MIDRLGDINEPASHPHLNRWVEALVPGRDRHALTLRTKGKPNRWERHVYRWAHAVPLTDSDDALPVNWCDVTVTNDAGKILYHNAGITDRELTADTVAGWVAAGRVSGAMPGSGASARDHFRHPGSGLSFHPAPCAVVR